MAERSRMVAREMTEHERHVLSHVPIAIGERRQQRRHQALDIRARLLLGLSADHEHCAMFSGVVARRPGPSDCEDVVEPSERAAQHAERTRFAYLPDVVSGEERGDSLKRLEVDLPLRERVAGCHSFVHRAGTSDRFRCRGVIARGHLAAEKPDVSDRGQTVLRPALGVTSAARIAAGDRRAAHLSPFQCAHQPTHVSTSSRSGGAQSG
jgi:hypothetical protein